MTGFPTAMSWQTGPEELRRATAVRLRAEVDAAYRAPGNTNQHQHEPRRSIMGAGAAEVPQRRRPEPAPDQDRQPQIEAMCAELVELREHACRLETQARAVEVRVLGPMPAEEGPAIASASVACLTGVVGADVRIARNALRGIGHSLDRIVQEFGNIGQE